MVDHSSSGARIEGEHALTRPAPACESAGSGPPSPLGDRTLDVSASRISRIIAGKRAISADTALRLARYFGTTPEFWTNLQRTYDLDLARQQLSKAISHIPQRPAAALPHA